RARRRDRRLRRAHPPGHADVERRASRRHRFGRLAPRRRRGCVRLWRRDDVRARPGAAHRAAGSGARPGARLRRPPPGRVAGRVLMAAQVAISVPLLVGAVLFLRTLQNLGAVDPGFDAERLVLFRVDPSLNGYDLDRVERTYGDVLQRVEAVSGVSSATLI